MDATFQSETIPVPATIWRDPRSGTLWALTLREGRMTDTLPSLTGARGGALIRADLLRARTLAVLRDVLADPIGQAFVELLDALAAYGSLFALLADEAELATDPLVGDAWQSHLLDRLLETETPFSRKAQRTGAAGLGRSLLAQVQRDLRALGALFSLDAQRLAGAV